MVQGRFYEGGDPFKRTASVKATFDPDTKALCLSRDADGIMIKVEFGDLEIGEIRKPTATCVLPLAGEIAVEVTSLEMNSERNALNVRLDAVSDEHAWFWVQAVAFA